MPGAYLWAWDSDLGDFRKVAVDAQGRLKVVSVIDELDDIGDVNVPTPTNNDLLYWDAAAGKWQDIAHLGLANAHHNQSHTLASHSTKPHSALTNVTGSQHHTKYTGNEAVSAVEAAGLALASGKNIKIIQALSADHTWSGLTAIMTAGEDLTIGQAVYVGGNSKMGKAKASSEASMPAIALATGTIDLDATGEFLIQGFFRDDTWTWSPGGILYISRDTFGAMSQTAPGTVGDQVQVVGIAITADIILFNPSYELVERS